MKWNDKFILVFFAFAAVFFFGKFLGRSWADEEWKMSIHRMGDKCEAEWNRVNRRD